jgi:hypothetical protein
MAGNKYVAVVAGVSTLVSANQTTAGVGDAGKIIALDSAGLLPVSMLPVGVGPDVKILVTSENLAVGAFVNIFDVVGVPTARNADFSNGREAHGYVLAATTSPASATIYLAGINNQLTGMVAGVRHYLSVTGTHTSTAPTTGILQYLGDAVTATELQFQHSDYIVM